MLSRCSEIVVRFIIIMVINTIFYSGFACFCTQFSKHRSIFRVTKIEIISNLGLRYLDRSWRLSRLDGRNAGWWCSRSWLVTDVGILYFRLFSHHSHYWAHCESDLVLICLVLLLMLLSYHIRTYQNRTYHVNEH